MASAYADDGGEPLLVDSYVLFIDSLGTVANAHQLTTERLRDLLNRRSTYLFMLKDDHIPDLQRTLMFTDNVVVGHVDVSDLGFLRTCFHGAAYQLGASLVGQFQRGGMASGPTYIGDGIAHGVGLIDAYKLEHGIAKYPRIVLSPALRERLATVAAMPLADGVNPEVVKRLFVRDADGEVFLDYLRVMADFASGVPEFGFTDLGAVLDEHKSRVESELQVDHDDQVRAKYVWLADYHNWAVGELELGSPIQGDFRQSGDAEQHSFASGWVAG